MVPVAFKDITADGKLLVGDVFLETTLHNIKANGKIDVAASDTANLEGYQIKGTAQYITDGPIVDTFKKLVEDMFKGATTASSLRSGSLLPLLGPTTKRSCKATT